MNNITDEVLVALSRKIPDDEDSRFTTALCAELLLARKSIDALINDISTGMYVQALQLTNSQLTNTNDALRQRLVEAMSKFDALLVRATSDREKVDMLEQALDTRQTVYDKLLADYTALKEKKDGLI